jgi:hypothetical protein
MSLCFLSQFSDALCLVIGLCDCGSLFLFHCLSFFIFPCPTYSVTLSLVSIGICCWKFSVCLQFPRFTNFQGSAEFLVSFLVESTRDWKLSLLPGLSKCLQVDCGSRNGILGQQRPRLFSVWFRSTTLSLRLCETLFPGQEILKCGFWFSKGWGKLLLFLGWNGYFQMVRLQIRMTIWYITQNLIRHFKLKATSRSDIWLDEPTKDWGNAFSALTKYMFCRLLRATTVGRPCATAHDFLNFENSPRTQFSFC